MNKDIENILLSGCSIQIGRLSIAPIQRTYNNIVYQVDSDDYKCFFSHLYKDLSIAVDKFILLKNQLYGNRKPQNKQFAHRN